MRVATIFLLSLATIDGFSAEPKPQKGPERVIVTFGDSTTAVRAGTQVYTVLLQEALEKSHRLVNSGIGGSTTEHGRKRFETDVLAHSPEVVVIQFGINDSFHDNHINPPRDKPRVPLARYVENLSYFIDELSKKKCRVILMTPNSMRWTENLKKVHGKHPYNPDDAGGLNATIKPYVEAVRKLAAEKKVDLIDVYAEYEKHAKAQGSTNDLLPDGMHPNDKGHRLVADKLLELLAKSEKKK